MKRLLSILLAAVLSATLFSACGQADQGGTSSQSAGTNTQSAKQIVIGRAADSLDLDPTTLNDTNSIWMLNLMLEGLVKTNDEGTQIVPNLAQKWEISEDGLVYTFHLIPDLKFADGTKVSKEDWLFSFERAMKETESYWYFSCSNISKVDAPDDQTVVLTLKTPSASTLSNLSMFNLAVQSKAYYEKVGTYAETAPMGTGPYIMKEWKKGEYMTLGKNPNYHEAGLPKTEELKFKVVADDDSRIMQLQSKDLDIIMDVPYSSMNTLKQVKGIQTVGVPSTSSRYLVLNTTDKIFSNEKVRQALLYATDKKQLVQTMLYGYGEEAVSYMPKNGMYWNDQITPVAYDTEKAKALLKEAGYENGFELEFLVPSGRQEFEQIATIVKEQWSKIGVNVNIVTLEKASLLDKEYAMKHQVLIGSWSDDLADPGQLGDYFWNFETSKAFYTGYKNEEATALYEKTKTELDDAKRKEYYFELQKIMYEASPVINLYHSDFAVAMSDSISGYVQTPLGKFSFDNLVKAEKN